MAKTNFQMCFCSCRSGNNQLLLLLRSAGGNCDMTCSAPTKCDFICTVGNSKKSICKADTCEESCTGGGCGLKCHGKSCEQSCTRGNCQLQCPTERQKCEQRCTINGDKCIINDLVIPNTKNLTTKAPAIVTTATEATTTVASTSKAPTTKVRSAPNECNEVRHGVCYQCCVGGGCTMECFNRSTLSFVRTDLHR